MTTKTNTTEPTTAQLRARYLDALRGLTYDNASRDQVRAAAEAKAKQYAADANKTDWPDAKPTPAMWTRAIESVRMPCKRCAGTGRFITRVENGVPTGPGGQCFRCGGTGTQDHSDGHRNRVHDLHYCPGVC